MTGTGPRVEAAATSPRPDAPPFRVGQTVRLASGGAAMTVLWVAREARLPLHGGRAAPVPEDRWLVGVAWHRPDGAMDEADDIDARCLVPVAPLPRDGWSDAQVESMAIATTHPTAPSATPADVECMEIALKLALLRGHEYWAPPGSPSWSAALTRMAQAALDHIGYLRPEE